MVRWGIISFLSRIKEKFSRKPLMYSSRICEDCQAAKKFFVAHEISMHIKYIEDKGIREELAAKYGKVLVPTIIIAGKKFIGFEGNKKEIKKRLKIY
ncbi:MAG: hypothetical protein FH762_00545 [Firmicutes bacterium]|nr:hypothetical protein [Bacillota bacterium]